MDYGSMAWGGGGGFDWGSKFGFGVKKDENPEFDKKEPGFGEQLTNAAATAGSRNTGDLVAKNDPSRRTIGGNRLVSSWRGGRP